MKDGKTTVKIHLHEIGIIIWGTSEIKRNVYEGKKIFRKENE